MLLSNLSVGSRSNVSCHSKGEKTVNDNVSDASNISRGGRASKIPRLLAVKPQQGITVGWNIPD